MQKTKHLWIRLLFAAAVGLLGVSAHAQCRLDNFTTRLQSTGTGPFNTSDVCTPGGTAHTPGNDACEQDSVVRTNDTYVYRMNFRVLNGSRENNITFRASLPLVGGRKVVVWDGLPAQCTGPGSSVSANGLDLVCNIGNVDRTGTGDLTSALLAPVKATVYGANGDQVSNVVASVTTDNCTSANNPNQTLPVVEISARQKADFRKDLSYGQTAYTYNGVPGFLVGYYIYTDQSDPSGAGSKGGQALNSPVTLKDILGPVGTGPASNNWPANAIWFDCFDGWASQGTISCPPRGTPVTNGGAGQDIVMTARPEEVGEFLVAGGRNTMVQRDPATPLPQRLNTFVVRFFVPLSDIVAAGGQLNLRNSIPAANIVGTAIDGQPIQDVNPNNNHLIQTVVASLNGGFYKYVAAQWGNSPWAGVTPGQSTLASQQLQGTNNWGDSGTGLLFPGQIFYPRVDYYNPDINPALNIVQCEAFDSTKVRLVEISSIPGHAASQVYEPVSSHQQPSGKFPQGYTVEYGVAPTQGGPGFTCDDGDATWFSDLNAAAAAGQRENLNRVRIRIPELAPGQTSFFGIAQQARPNVNGTIIDDYYSVRASNLPGDGGTRGVWRRSNYDVVNNFNLSSGKRFTLTTSLARIQKQAAVTDAGPNVNQATAGGTVIYKLQPALQTVITNPPSTYVTIVDRLPAPLTYVDGSAQLGGNPFPPESVVSDATGTTITWTISNLTPNQPIPELRFRANVPQTIPPNQSKVNTVVISTPDDSSPESQRTATKALTILNPPGLYVNKAVASPLIDPSGTARWKLQISNFEPAATSVDIIDVLPFVGDGRTPATAYSGTRGLTAQIAAPASGGVVRYSSRPSSSVLFDPVAPGNAATAANGWCLFSEFGSAGCPATLADVTAFRVSNAPIAANTTIEIDFDTATQLNQLGDIYTNRFYAKSTDPQLGTLRSNDVRVTVALGSLSGKVYVDADLTATQNGPSDVPIQGVAITLCRVAPVSGSCPAGQTVTNPITGAPITATTAADGTYTLSGVPSNTTTGYFIVEQRPAGYGNGPLNAPGSLGGTPAVNAFNAVRVPVGANGTNYNFGHTAVDLNTTVTLPSAPVAPGSTVNGTVQFGNSTPTNGESTTATITLTPNLTGVVITPPAGWSITSPYNPTTGEVRLAPNTGVFPANSTVTVNVQFTAPEASSVTVRSSISNAIQDITPITDPTSTNPNRNAHQATVGVLAQQIDVTKRAGVVRGLSAAEQSALGIAASEPAFLVPYRIVVANRAIATATNVQVVDQLSDTFPAPATIVRVQQTAPNASTGITTGDALGARVYSSAVNGVASASQCAPNAAVYNGTTQIRLLAGNFDLAPNEQCLVEFAVIVKYPSSTQVPSTILRNSAFASTLESATPGTVNPGASITGGVPSYPSGTKASDASTDSPQLPAGTAPNSQFPAEFPPAPSTSNGDSPQPTPVRLNAPPPAPVAAIKYVENVTLPGTPVVGGQLIEWTVVYKNEGNTPLTQVQVQDRLDANLSNPSIVSVVRTPANAAQVPRANPAYNGNAVIDLLEAPLTLAPGDVLTIKIRGRINPTYVGNLTNQASLHAVEYGGAGGDRVLTSAVNPTSPACPSAQACIPSGVTVPSRALNSQPAGNTAKDQPNVLQVARSGAIAGTAWFDANNDIRLDPTEQRVPGLRVAIFAINPSTGERIGEVTDPNNRPVTDRNGNYQVGGLAPSSSGGPEYEVVFYNEAGTAVLGVPAPMASGPNNGRLPASGPKDRITSIKVSEGEVTPAQNLPLDPSGVVYDSTTRRPIEGAVVTLNGPAGFNPAIHLQGGVGNVSQTTGPTGFYQFILTASAPAGEYSLSVVPPAGYVNPSSLIPAQPGALTPPAQPGTTFRVQPQAGAPQIASNDPTTYYTRFNLRPGVSADVVHNHYPLDPARQPEIALAKTVSRPVAELGDVVTYQLRVRNIGQTPVPGVTVEDRLPAGFRFIPGTVRIATGTAAAVAAADPAGGVGPSLTFSAPGVIPINGETVISYRVRIGVGALQGDGINRARARTGRFTSNEARAKVKVQPGVFTNDACVVGKVFVDCNNNHIQDAEELGVPGVRLYLQDGTNMITDSEGKYSYCGLPANSSVIKVDSLTLPRGSRLSTTSSRNLGDGTSLFLDAKGGQLVRADFAETSCSNTVLEQVKARRTQGEVRNPQTEKRGQPAKKFEGKSASYPAQGTDSANQTILKPRTPAAGGPSKSEENEPVPNLPSASHKTRGTNNPRDGQ